MDGALSYFERALEFDNDYVEAHIGIGAVHAEQYWSGGGSDEGLREARDSYVSLFPQEIKSYLSRDPASGTLADVPEIASVLM